LDSNSFRSLSAISPARVTVDGRTQVWETSLHVKQLQTSQAHCRVYHGWIYDHGAGRPSPKRKRRSAERRGTSPELPWSENVTCQRSFRLRNASGWFEVARKSLPVWAPKIYPSEACDPFPAPPTTSKSKNGTYINKAVQQDVEAVLQRHDRHVQAQNQPRVRD
jgi:hypothetical protein